MRGNSVRASWRSLAVVVLAVAAVSGMAVGQGRAGGPNTDADDALPKLFIPHTPSSKNFPCSKCHRHMAANPQRRALELSHTNIVLKHAEKNRWCLDCHDGDKLRLPNGELVDYDKSYILCGQCHGTILRDWKAGIHGKRTGAWNGARYYRVCVSCHDAHQPKFKAIEPEPAPIEPANLK